MVYFDLGWLYPYYHKWMSKSIDYDDKEWLWKTPKEAKEVK